MEPQSGHAGIREVALGIALLGLVSASACNRVCATSTAAACEGEWSRTRVAVALGRFPWGEERDAWDGADAVIDGGDALAVGWHLGVAGDDVVFGMPEIDEVRLGAYDALVADLDAYTGSAGFGTALALGDVDDDDVADLWVAAPGAEVARGRVSLFLDATAVRDEDDADGSLVGLEPGDRFGSALVACDDVTGDGVPDWAIGAPGSSVGEDSLVGSAWLIRSEQLAGDFAEEDPALVGYRFDGESAGDAAGTALTCSGDLTGDGVADLVVGAPYAGSGSTQPGAVYIVAGGAALPAGGALAEVAEIVLIPDDDVSACWLGRSLLTVDLALDADADEADGFVDLVVGGPGDRAGRGAAIVWSGKDLADRRLSARAILREPDSGSHFGMALAAGDINGDGRPELFVGAPDRAGDDTDRDLPGAGWVSGWDSFGMADWDGTLLAGTDDDYRVLGTEAFQRVGRHIAIGDVDGDTLPDVLLPTQRRGGR